jgi:hypothetical protein
MCRSAIGLPTSGCTDRSADVAVGDAPHKWLDSGNATGEYQRERGARHFILCRSPPMTSRGAATCDIIPPMRPRPVPDSYLPTWTGIVSGIRLPEWSQAQLIGSVTPISRSPKEGRSRGRPVSRGAWAPMERQATSSQAFRVERRVDDALPLRAINRVRAGRHSWHLRLERSRGDPCGQLRAGLDGHVSCLSVVSFSCEVRVRS